MSFAMNRRRALIAGSAATFLLLSACSGEKEDPGAGSNGDCEGSEEATNQYEQAWINGQEALGLSGLEPPDLEICMVDTSEYKTEPGDDGYRIGFAAQGPTNSWALENEEAFTYHADELGVEVLYASANGDATAQVDNIAQLAAQQPDALVVVPMGPGITGQVRAASQQGIPVVLCAGRLDGDSGAVSTVTRSYELQATLWAEWLIEKIGGEGKVAMLSGIAGVPTAEFQKAAAEKVFAEHPEIEVVTKQYTDWSPTKSKTVAANLLAQYPDLDGIWSDSAISDLGVIEAYRDAGQPVPPLTGDSSNALLKGAQGTDVQFALSAFPPEQSMQCLDVAMDILEGESVPNIVNVDSVAYTHEDLEEYIRPECSDNLWVPSSLPDPLLSELDLC